jgi:hypothetical protein
MKQYKIELFTKPIFDNQYRYRVFEVDYGNSAKEYKETIIVSGNDTLAKVKKEVKYWFSR